MPREPREFKRIGAFRDASLVIIACEGAETEPKYFNGLKAKLHTPKIHVEVLARPDPSQSSPAAVLGMIDDFKTKYRARQGDRFWLAVDRDQWPAKMLADVARTCEHRDYQLAVSNPCFEIWLLLHLVDVSSAAAGRQQELFQNKNQILKAEIGSRMMQNVEYIDHFLPHTQTAIQRAKAMDKRPGARWPNYLGTRVYRLVASFLPEA